MPLEAGLKHAARQLRRRAGAAVEIDDRSEATRVRQHLAYGDGFLAPHAKGGHDVGHGLVEAQQALLPELNHGQGDEGLAR